MAKAPAVKPKSSFADWFRRAPKAKAAARPGTSPTSSTLTNIPVAAGPATKPGRDSRAAGASKPKAQAYRPAATFEIPFLAGRPITKQMQLLGFVAALVMLLLAAAVYVDTRSRTQGATQISILSQMQFHTQRLANAAGLAARGQPAAFPQLADSPDQFAEYLAVLREGGSALGVDVPSAATTDELASRLDCLANRWPCSSHPL